MGSNDPEGDLREIEDDLTKYPKLALLLTGGKSQDNAQVDSTGTTDTVGPTGSNVSGLRNSTEANPK
jgi:hypothetical protein